MPKQPDRTGRLWQRTSSENPPSGTQRLGATATSRASRRSNVTRLRSWGPCEHQQKSGFDEVAYSSRALSRCGDRLTSREVTRLRLGQPIHFIVHRVRHIGSPIPQTSDNTCPDGSTTVDVGRPRGTVGTVAEGARHPDIQGVQDDSRPWPHPSGQRKHLAASQPRAAYTAGATSGHTRVVGSNGYGRPKHRPTDPIPR